MTDFRALCIELTDCLEKADWPLRYRYVFRQWVDIARAALADGPAVPEGREPASVAGQPSDEAWDALVERAWDKYQTVGYQGERFMYDRDFGNALEFVRQGLARWNNPAPQPLAEGEVAELVAWLREIAQLWEPDAPRAKQLFRAADLLERLAPQPPAEGEVEDVVRWLRSRAGIPASPDFPAVAPYLTRAADLLQRLSPPQPVPVASDIYFEFVVSDADYCTQAGGTAPTYAQALSEGQHYLAQCQLDGPHTLELRRVEVLNPDDLPLPTVEQLTPVPVSERLPGAEDCDAEGRYWGLINGCEAWVLGKGSPSTLNITHWLSAHALPIPHQQENAND